MHHPCREREGSDKRTGYNQPDIKISEGVCCKNPSCIRRIKNTTCNNCNADCKNCDWNKQDIFKYGLKRM